MITSRGIEVNLDKIQVIMSMKERETLHDIQKLNKHWKLLVDSYLKGQKYLFHSLRCFVVSPRLRKQPVEKNNLGSILQVKIFNNSRNT